jgi:hypothetical protein
MLCPARRPKGRPPYKSGMVFSGHMPPPPKKPQKRLPATPRATRPPEKIKKPPVQKPLAKKPFERFRLEFYGSAILAILLVALPMTWYVKCIFLVVIAAMVSDLAWNSPVAMRWSRNRKLLRWAVAIVVLALVGWVSIRTQYREDTKQRLREPMAQILAQGAKLQDACLSDNSEEAEAAATAWGGETGKWLTDNLGSPDATRFNNPTGQILPGSRYNAVQQRCWSYVTPRMIALKDIANDIEHQ